MKAIILAAGQGTRLRPFTDDRPKCMVAVNGKSILERQLDVMHACGIHNEDIMIVTGYRGDVIQQEFRGAGIHILVNRDYEHTNMVCSLMCAESILKEQKDVLISYGDIIYSEEVLQKILDSEQEASVVVDDGWFGYWSKRCENPLDDAETLLLDEHGYLTEIGQKTKELARVQSQYIGLLRFQGAGLTALLRTVSEAQRRTDCGEGLWRTPRTYQQMYMTDLLQGMIDEGALLKAVHIDRGWYEIDDCDDLKLVERSLAGQSSRQ